MTPPIDIRADQLRIVQDVLHRHLPDGVKVWVFGSRASWTTKDSSDLDLALDWENEIPLGSLSALESAFEDSDLPYAVDIVDLKRVNERFRRIVQQQRVKLVGTADGTGRKDWRNTHWGDLVTLEYGRSLRGYDTAEGAFRVFGTNGPIGWHDEALSKGASVIVGRKGAYRGIHYSPNPCFVIDTAFYLKTKAEVDVRWAYYTLLTQDINGLDSGSAIPSTSRKDFYALPVSVPPRTEQRAIAHVLGTLDDKIELNRRMNATLEAMARALFRSWFVDFDPVRAKMEGRDTGLPPDIADLFPDRIVESELGELPDGWRPGKVEDAFEIIMGQSPPGHTYNDTGDGLPFFQGRSDFGFRYPKNRKYCTAPNRLAQPWDTIVSVRAPVGDINMARERCCIGRGVAALRSKSGAVSFGYCTAQALQTYMREYEHTGTVFGAINRKQLARLPLRQPQTDIVRAFERLVYPWDQTIRLRTAEVDTLTALRDALLPKLVSGELRVNDAGPVFARDDRLVSVGAHQA